MKMNEERHQVILTDKGASASDIRPTHAVDIFAFVEAQEIPFHYFGTPYYLAPPPGGERAYEVLREALRRTRKIGIAHVVIQMRRHVAALVPQGKALVLNPLQFSSEARRGDALCFAPQEFAEAADISESELDAATRLVDSMTCQWDALRQESATQIELTAAGNAAPEVIELEDLLDLAEQGGLGLEEELMDRLWGRPHRRPARAAHRTAMHGRLRRR